MIQITENQTLKPFNTFGIDCFARYFCSVSSKSELLQALDFGKTNQLQFLILGGGSNLLISKNFEGLVIKIENKGIEVVGKTDKKTEIKVSAGENWHNLVIQSLESSWFGLENLSLIPGNVGASPMQNIGAYGIEVKDLITNVEFYNIELNEWQNFNPTQCQFGYRESIFKHELKGKAIIWSVTFSLSLIPEAKIEYGDIKSVLTRKQISNPGPKDVSDAVIEIRQSKLPDPKVLGNAGSFFKNPMVQPAILEEIKKKYPEVPNFASEGGLFKIPAGWLIEKAGWKGKSLGNYGVHDRQALVLVNYGNASGMEIFELAQSIQHDIKSKFNIELQVEVNLI